MERNESKAAGGYARAESLTAEERQDIARKAAEARWNSEVTHATHEGTFSIGNATVAAAVLPNGKRLLTQGTFLKALGRSRSPKAGTGVQNTVDGIPAFLQADVLKPFISEELMMSTTPIFFRGQNGRKLIGYDANLLPMVADVYLRFRDACAVEHKTIPHQYAHIVRACDLIVRGLARVGIAALIDEATGYQEVRDRQALQAILDMYLRQEFAAWAKRFPDEFYQEIFRLRGWEWRGMKINRPQCVAQYTNNLIYERLAPGILEELKRRNPKNETTGRRVGMHHQLLTEDVGHPALAQQLFATLGLMRASKDWNSFMRLLDRAHPKKEQHIQLDIHDVGVPLDPS